MKLKIIVSIVMMGAAVSVFGAKQVVMKRAIPEVSWDQLVAMADLPEGLSRDEEERAIYQYIVKLEEPVVIRGAVKHWSKLVDECANSFGGMRGGYRTMTDACSGAMPDTGGYGEYPDNLEGGYCEYPDSLKSIDERSADAQHFYEITDSRLNNKGFPMPHTLVDMGANCYHEPFHNHEGALLVELYGEKSVRLVDSRHMDKYIAVIKSTYESSHTVSLPDGTTSHRYPIYPRVKWVNADGSIETKDFGGEQVCTETAKDRLGYYNDEDGLVVEGYCCIDYGKLYDFVQDGEVPPVLIEEAMTAGGKTRCPAYTVEFTTIGKGDMVWIPAFYYHDLVYESEVNIGCTQFAPRVRYADPEEYSPYRNRNYFNEEYEMSRSAVAADSTEAEL